MDDQIDDVLTKPLALGRSSMFSRLRFPLKENDESVSHSDMVRGLVPSMVRCKG